MASRTQLRLQQVTGSLVNLKTEAGQYVTPAAAAALTGSDLQDVLGAFAASLNRIHGAASDEPFNNVAGTIRSANNAAAAIKLHADAGSSQTIKFINDEGTGNNAIDIEATAGGINMEFAASKQAQISNANADLFVKLVDDAATAGNEKITIKNTNGTGNDSINLDSTAGSVFVNVDSASKRFYVDSEGGADIEAVKGLSLSNASAAGGDDITITQTGANDSSIIITAAGTGTDAIDINATAGDMLIGKALADGKTLKLGKNGRVEMVFSPNSGAVSNEKFSIVNTGGTAADAVKIHADAGGLQLLADSTSHGVVIGTGTSGVPISIGHTTSEVTVNDNLTVTGDLTVNGATVTIDATNLKVEDPVILLGSGSTSSNSNGGIAIVSGSNTAANALVFGRVANDVWGVGRKDITDGTVTTLADMTLVDIRASSIQLGAAQESISGDGDDITFALGAGGDINIPTDIGLTFGNDGEKIEGNGSQLTIASRNTLTLDSAGDIELNADGGDIFLDDGSTRYGAISLNANADGADANDLMISASLGSLGLDANGGMLVMLQAGSQFLYFEKNSDDAKIFPAGNGANDILFEDGAESGNEVFRVDGGLQALAMPQQNAAGNAANTGILSFNANNDVNEAIYGDGSALYLRSNAVNFKLPTADGNADQVLKTDGSGNLGFADASGDLARLSAKITATISADSSVSFDSGNLTSGVSILKGTTLNITKADADLDKSLEVFVNGQLLMSGAADNADADYSYINSGSIRFEFALEPDDIVQVIQR